MLNECFDFLTNELSNVLSISPYQTSDAHTTAEQTSWNVYIRFNSVVLSRGKNFFQNIRQRREIGMVERRFALSGASSVCDSDFWIADWRSPWEGETSLMINHPNFPSLSDVLKQCGAKQNWCLCFREKGCMQWYTEWRKVETFRQWVLFSVKCRAWGRSSQRWQGFVQRISPSLPRQNKPRALGVTYSVPPSHVGDDVPTVSMSWITFLGFIVGMISRCCSWRALVERLLCVKWLTIFSVQHPSFVDATLQVTSPKAHSTSRILPGGSAFAAWLRTLHCYNFVVLDGESCGRLTKFPRDLLTTVASKKNN